MGSSEVTAPKPSFTDCFNEVFPYYLAIGMTYEQFWEGEPILCEFYRKADRIQRKRANEQLWINGMYTTEALLSSVGNMFSKGRKHKYPSEPFPITVEEQQEKAERERKAKMESIKAKFTSRALATNAKMGEKL